MEGVHGPETDADTSPEWSPHMPLGCPLEGAVALDGVVYRLVKSATPAEGDFKSFAELNVRHTDGECPCRRAGVSISLTADEARLMQGRIPRLARKLIAAGTVRPEDGLMKSKERGPGHTMWIRAKAAPMMHTRFKVVGNGQ